MQLCQANSFSPCSELLVAADGLQSAGGHGEIKASHFRCFTLCMTHQETACLCSLPGVLLHMQTKQVDHVHCNVHGPERVLMQTWHSPTNTTLTCNASRSKASASTSDMSRRCFSLNSGLASMLPNPAEGTATMGLAIVESIREQSKPGSGDTKPVSAVHILQDCTHDSAANS